MVYSPLAASHMNFPTEDQKLLLCVTAKRCFLKSCYFSFMVSDLDPVCVRLLVCLHVCLDIYYCSEAIVVFQDKHIVGNVLFLFKKRTFGISKTHLALLLTIEGEGMEMSVLACYSAHKPACKKMYFFLQVCLLLLNR